MADAAEEVAGLPDLAIRLKWPNDLVVETTGLAGVKLANASGPEAGRLLDAPLEVRKLGGVLGETIGLGTTEPRVIIGLGINADWAKDDFPAELADTMTSLREASNGRPIELAGLFAAFIDRVEARTIALRGGHFDVADWTTRQLTSGRPVRLDLPDGKSLETRALGVDTESGGLVIEDEAGLGGERTILLRRDQAAPPRRSGCNAVARPVFRKMRTGRRRTTVSSISTAIEPWSRPPCATLPPSTRCIGSTSPRCTATRITSSAAMPMPRTPPNARSCSR